MKIFRIFNTVYYRLLISYILLLTISTILIGATSYTYFSSRYNDEIEDVNNLVLNNISRDIRENIVEKISKICIDITMDQRKNEDILYYLKYQDRENENIRIKNIQKNLGELIIVNSDIIDSISIYYKNNNFIIGSSYGVTFLEQNQDPFSDSPWMKKIKERKSSYIWLDNGSLPPEIYGFTNTDMLTYIYLFTDSSISPDYQGFIKVNIKKSTFQDRIQEYLPKESSMSLIADSSGTVICDFGNADLFDPVEFNKQIKSLPAIYENIPSESYTTEIGQVDSVVSYRSLEYTGWNLINVIPLDKYYIKTKAIKRTLIAICIVSIIIGVLISMVLTSKIYNPIRSIIKRTVTLFGNGGRSCSKGENEYAYINDFIDNLSVKVNELESTLKTNLPLIKYNLVQDIIYKNIEDIQDVKEQLKISDISMPFKYFYLTVLTMDQEALSYANMENTQFIKYNLVNYIDSCTDFKSSYISAAISKNEFVIITNSDSESTDFLTGTLDKVIDYVYNSFKIPAYTAIGGKTTDLLEIHFLFKTAKNILKYNFFYPEIKVLNESLVQSENCGNEIPEKLLEDIAVSLNNRDTEVLSENLEVFINLTRSRDVNSEHSHQKLLELVYLLTRYMREIGITLDDSASKEFSEYKNVSNINQFKEWFLSVAERTFHALTARENNQKHEMLQKINDYIVENLEKDISLSYVADMAGLSPNYLSRIYREETGDTFINFVSNVKMNKAKELLQETNLTIDEISQKLGYGSSAYFIKKFKDNFGVTPSKYR